MITLGAMDVQLVFRPALARLSRAAFHHNLKILKDRLSRTTGLHKKNCEIMAVVKANAYGHQADRVAPELLKKGIRSFCVASLEEGMALRRVAPKALILVLGGTSQFSGGTLDVIRQQKFHLGVNDISALKFFISHADIPLHLKIDTGMNRLGVKADEWGQALDLLLRSKRKLAGLYSHYACFRGADFRKQVYLFDELAKWYWNSGLQPQYLHTENSAAIFTDEKFSKNSFLAAHGNMARPGLSMYGYLPRNFHLKVRLKPVLELSSEVSWVKSVKKGEGISYDFLYKAKKDHDIGVVPIGYADGIAKAYREDLHPVLMDKRGRLKANLDICGSVCMDTLMVKASGRSLNVGERVVFWGHRYCDFASKKRVDPYELNLRIASRIPRVWVS